MTANNNYQRNLKQNNENTAYNNVFPTTNLIVFAFLNVIATEFLGYVCYLSLSEFLGYVVQLSLSLSQCYEGFSRPTKMAFLEVNILFLHTSNIFLNHFFLQWRKFSFFDLKPQVDGGKVATALTVSFMCR